ncbi:MAG: hypothetical protein P8X74_16280 [Reinekea sp.]
MFNFFKKLFDQVVPGFKAALPILLIIIFVLLNVAIWWAGPWLSIHGEHPLASVMARAVTSIIFSLTCLALWGLGQWRALKTFQEIAAAPSYWHLRDYILQTLTYLETERLLITGDVAPFQFSRMLSANRSSIFRPVH